jgi:uncharacterized protein YqgC (DUF456 family)
VVLVIALAGTVVPILPGALLAAVAIIAWAFLSGEGGAWLVTALALALLIVGQVLKYVVPARTLGPDAVPTRVLLAGAAAGIVGFFVLPVIGLPVGFVVGVWVATVIHRRSLEGSWPATRAALTAIGVGTAIEFGSVLWAALVWAAGAVILAL